MSLIEYIKKKLKELAELLERKKNEKHGVPTLYEKAVEAIEEMERAVEEVEKSGRINEEALRQVAEVTTELVDKFAILTPEQIKDTMQNLLTMRENLTKEQSISVTTDDFSKAWEIMFHTDNKDVSGIYMDVTNNSVYIEKDNETYKVTVDSKDMVQFIKCDLEKEVRDSMVTLFPKDGEQLEDMLLRAVSNANGRLYETEKERLDDTIRTLNQLHRIIQKADEPFSIEDGKYRCLYDSSSETFYLRDMETEGNPMMAFHTNKSNANQSNALECTFFEKSNTDFSVSDGTKSQKLATWRSGKEGKLEKEYLLPKSTKDMPVPVKNFMKLDTVSSFLQLTTGMDKAEIKRDFKLEKTPNKNASKLLKYHSKLDVSGDQKAKFLQAQLSEMLPEGYSVRVERREKENTLLFSIHAPDKSAYYLNLNKDGSIKSHVFQKGQNGSLEKVLESSRNGGADNIINRQLANDAEFSKIRGMVVNAQEQAEKAFRESVRIDFAQNIVNILMENGSISDRDIMVGMEKSPIFQKLSDEEKYMELVAIRSELISRGILENATVKGLGYVEKEGLEDVARKILVTPQAAKEAFKDWHETAEFAEIAEKVRRLDRTYDTVPVRTERTNTTGRRTTTRNVETARSRMHETQSEPLYETVMRMEAQKGSPITAEELMQAANVSRNIAEDTLHYVHGTAQAYSEQEYIPEEPYHPSEADLREMHEAFAESMTGQRQNVPPIFDSPLPPPPTSEPIHETQLKQLYERAWQMELKKGSPITIEELIQEMNIGRREAESVMDKIQETRDLLDLMNMGKDDKEKMPKSKRGVEYDD